MIERICLGFTSFRPETLPSAGERMREFRTVALEEPQTPGFEEMLRGELAVEEYLLLTDFAFVRFAEDSCRLMQSLHKQGTAIRQMDPYMDELVRIHEFFASGGTPEGITDDSLTGEVYACERIWTAKLLDFYGASRRSDFQKVVESVKAFARIDAERGRFRNRLRADALQNMFSETASLYVEAGYLHLGLQAELLRRLPRSCRFESFYVLAEIIQPLIGAKQLYGPGDELTFIYTFNRKQETRRSDLLAARSLIYNKIVAKDEMLPTRDEPWPHVRDEVQAVAMANSLSYKDCAELYPTVRSLPTGQALETVRRWLAGTR